MTTQSDFRDEALYEHYVLYVTSVTLVSIDMPAVVQLSALLFGYIRMSQDDATTASHNLSNQDSTLLSSSQTSSFKLASSPLFDQLDPPLFRRDGVNTSYINRSRLLSPVSQSRDNRGATQLNSSEMRARNPSLTTREIVLTDHASNHKESE